ncbi:MAG: hypothetical protein K2N49_02190 [Ruminococcus sp.]|nr:hypothetical protein [Ruminococcus sp.]MDE7225657.1 hypothetical protein [Ruminococcus sp.]
MENIKTAVIAVCGISAVRCIIGGISSSAKLKNNVMMILNIMLAVVMSAPFLNGCSEFEIPEFSGYSLDYDYSQDKYAQKLCETTAENISEILEQQFSSSGIYCEKILVEVNISAEYSISISRVMIITEDFEAAALIVKSCLGAETEVVNGAE